MKVTEEFGSVSSTPDSTPPCTDDGNEESDFPELQTAREWSEDEYGGEDDEGAASSPSVWGTPRQSSLELTFSYIAFTESEGGRVSRRDSMGGGRRRGGVRSGRASLNRVDARESLVPAESPELEWEQRAYMSVEGHERDMPQPPFQHPPRQLPRPDLDMRIPLPPPFEPGLELAPPSEPRLESRTPSPSEPNLELRIPTPSEPSQELGIPTPSEPSLEQRILPPSRGSDSEPQSNVWDGTSRKEEEEEETSGLQQYSQKDDITGEAAVAMETTTELLMSAHQPGSEITEAASSASTSPIRRNTQEEPVSKQHLLALNLSEGDGLYLQILVADLIYWRDMERTGMVFTGLVVGLLSLFQLSIISVIATVSLLAMCFTISVRLYYKVLHVLQWNDGKHPFQRYLDLDITLSAEQAGTYMERIIVMTTSAIAEFKRLLFVDSLFDSLKFLTLMYLLTFLGDLFNGLTLLIIAVICVFSLPLFYKRYQAQVDGLLGKVKASVDNAKDLLRRLSHIGKPAQDPNPAPGGAKPKIK
ncbi:hypothetical protein GJAV_G00051620 [Gymnothorax javanicus]|nr:hypothetical protein GJAV_G00051620 [Gymnothorax javanicus]